MITPATVVDQNFYINLIAVIARSSILVIAALTAALSIWLGWKLYKDAVLSRTEGEAKSGALKIKLAAAGPGVFFVAFGMWTLVALVNRPFELESANPTDCKQQTYFRPSVQENESRPDGLLKIAETDGTNRKQTAEEGRCVIRSKLRFLGGPEAAALAPGELETLFEVAIGDMRRAIVGTNPKLDQPAIEQRRRAVQVFRDLEIGIVP